MAQIRVLLGEMPRMMRDVFTQVISEQADMQVVGELANGVGLLLAAGQTKADVVIMSLQDSEMPGIASHLLNEYPSLKVLGVATNGRKAFLYHLRPEKVPVGEVSPEGLLTVIRSAVHAHGGLL